MPGDPSTNDERRAPRERVRFVAIAYGPHAQRRVLDVGDLSAMGLTARVEGGLSPGDRLRIVLPVIGAVAAEVRWASDGAIGCEFDAAIDLASYFEMLAAILKR